jgi:two-component system sensor histidine kinase AlgZ
MLLQDVIQYERERLRNPWVRLPMFILGGAIVLGMLPLLVASSARSNPATWMVLTLAAVSLPLLVLGLSPAPWLWTGGRASHAPLLRGIAQSALFNAVLLLLILAIHTAIIFLLALENSLVRAAGSIFLNLMIWGPAAMLAGFSITVWERTKYAKDETERRLREAQWVLLRGQLSPHVLFNALNGLAELVHVDPAAAEQGLLDLSDLYRALLAHGSHPMAPLGEERTLVARYLGIETMRLGDRLKVTWEWDDRLDNLRVPPFLVQPLVENALKHGIAPHPAGGELRIGLAQDVKELIIRVANTGRPLPPSLGNGIGRANLEARLGLAFGDKAQTRLFTDGNWTVAEIRVNLHEIRRKA